MKEKTSHKIIVLSSFICLNIAVFAQKNNGSRTKKEEKINQKGKEDSHTMGQKPNNELTEKAMFYEAIRLQTIGAIDSAIALFEVCTIKNPNNDAAFFQLAEYFGHKHQYNKALSNIEQACKIDPNNIWYLEGKAFFQMNVGDYENAEVSYKSLSEKQAHNMDWLYGYAQAQLFNGKIKGAILSYAKMIDEIGPVPELVGRKIELMEDQKMSDQVVAELNQLIKDYPTQSEYGNFLVDFYQKKGDQEKAKAVLENLLKNDPNNGSYQLRLASMYGKLNEQQKSYAYLKQAFNNENVDIDTKVKILINIHDDAKEKIDTNVYALMQILEKLYPENAKTYSIIGDLYLRTNRQKEALINFKKALLYDHSKYSIWNEVLVLQYKQKQFDSLFTYGTKALEYFPNYADMYLLTGIGALKSNHLEDAESYFTQGPNYALSDKPLRAEFAANLAETYLEKGELENAWQAFESSIILDSNNAVYQNNFAFALAEHAISLEKALSLAAKAVKNQPSNANYLDTYAWIYFRQKNYSSAKEWIEKALAISPKNPNILEHYGDILFFLGDKNAALENWKTAKQLGNTSNILLKKITNNTYFENDEK